MKTLALLGGTFNPIHYGHLRSALELVKKLSLDELRLVPCRIPPHRDEPETSAKQRLDMLGLALSEIQSEDSRSSQSDHESDRLVLDARELERDGASYTFDTLQSIREEEGEEVSLAWVMGMDAFLSFDEWYEWEKILDLAHLIVIDRPGYTAPSSGVIAHLLHARQLDHPDGLKQSAYGRIFCCALEPFPISATEIRQQLKSGLKIPDWLPPPVLDYIHQHCLYGAIKNQSSGDTSA